MLKLLLILFVGLLCESAGVVLLKKGMTQIGDMNGYTAAEIFRVFKSGLTSQQILLGMFFEALFFIGLLVLMAKCDISFLWPLTGLSFVFATFAAMWFLGEHVSPTRWIGVILHHDRRGVHQLQRTREGKARAACGNESGFKVGRRCRAAGRAAARPYHNILARTPASRSAANLVFFCNSINAPIFPGDLAMAHASLPKSRLLSGLASALKSSGKSSSAVSEITRTVTQ